ncbi:MAG TPA: PilZ domain-containing protein [Verrucomicrobiae bacterium]|jgi:hypothetical protein
MSAKRVLHNHPFEQPLTVATAQARLELSADTVAIHKSGIEFRSPTPFTEWAEMTVSLQSPADGSQLSCTGVIIACVGSKHTGYHVSMIFTDMTREAQEQLSTMAQSSFGSL